jgi:hypothetical protein
MPGGDTKPTTVSDPGFNRETRATDHGKIIKLRLPAQLGSHFPVPAMINSLG